MEFLHYSAFLESSILALLAIASVIVSLKENEKRAAMIFSILANFFIVLSIAIFYLNSTVVNVIDIVVNSLIIAGCLIFLIPFNRTKRTYRVKPKTGYDERDIIFSRDELKVDTERYNEYYKLRPENKSIDDLNRSRSGLLSEESKKYHLSSFNLADAAFFAVDKLKVAVDGKVSATKKQLDPHSLTKFIKELALKYGASDSGVTLLKDYHKYETIGRDKEYGKKVDLDHKFAIALAVEMDHEMIKTSPNGPVITESSRIYLETGLIAVQLAQFIRQMGFDARAHIDGNYRVICPLVARDAGLGEIGRMGILMTPKLGPRVRVSVVTTNIDLIEDKRPEDTSVSEFCELCKKCSDNCPTNAISPNEMEEVDGVVKWQLDHTSCFSFWTINGTDCAKCISVCPYSHPNNSLHNFVRWGIRNNHFFRKLALSLDNLFYGRKPKSKAIPEWMNIKEIN